ncbi:autotransporter outer membrane beta-barrel domain-containing protein [Microvirga sp. W0021]|uniref:Autotransporter outer membrane beta-barrel domain-containing protein n=1 Tax=Hohaiivirga grylli TaxID=3133970 RepID=A0ABV0BK75_9HYPH
MYFSKHAVKALLCSTAIAGLLVSGGYGLVEAQSVSGSGDLNSAVPTSPVWNVSGSLRIGYSGVGNLEVLNGGKVTSGAGTMGYNAGSSGTVTLSGAGSQWTITGLSYIGYYGTGRLEILDGAVVTASNFGHIGQEAGSNGTVIVSGSGSRWGITNDIVVGYNGSGEFLVSDGATVTSTTGVVASQTGSTGIAEITGPGTTWTINNFLYVAGRGTGTLKITDGAKVSATTGYVSNGNGGNGTVIVSGENSALSISNYLNIGYIAGGASFGAATGELTINNGGLVTVGGKVFLGELSSTTGILNIGSASGEAATAPGKLQAAAVEMGSGQAILNFNHTDVSSTYDFSTDISGVGTVKNEAGVTTLSGTNTYTGTTSVSSGTTLKAGSTSAFGLSDAIVAAGATLDFNSFDNTIGMLDNSGTVILANGAPGHTLTVTGGLTSNGGRVVMNTALGNDSSATDRLILDGGTTTGTTNLMIVNSGGTGAVTTTGIRVVETINGATTAADAFTLDPSSPGYRSTTQSLAVGAYDYRLIRSGSGGVADDWYLSTEATGGVLPPTGGGSGGGGSEGGGSSSEGPGVTIPGPQVSIVRPEAGAYLANQNAARSMFMMSYHDREGFGRSLNGKQNGGYGWARVIGGRSDYSAAGKTLNIQSDTIVVQAGISLLNYEGSNGTFHGGLMVGYGNTSSDIKSNRRALYKAKGEVDGYSVGVYGTWHQNEQNGTGLYVDGWAQYGWYDNSVHGYGLNKEKYDSRTFTVSLEAGYGFELMRSESWQVLFQPQVQVAYVNYSADSHFETGGATLVKSKKDDGFVTRVGGRFSGVYTYDGNKKLRPYMEANWWYREQSGALLMNSDFVRSDLPRNSAEIKLGIQGEFANGWEAWGEVSTKFGGNGYSDVGGLLGVKYTW